LHVVHDPRDTAATTNGGTGSPMPSWMGSGVGVVTGDAVTLIRQSGGLLGQLGDRIQSSTPPRGGGISVVPGTNKGLAPGGSGGTTKCNAGTAG
jgi:hypothetical protein